MRARSSTPSGIVSLILVCGCFLPSAATAMVGPDMDAMLIGPPRVIVPGVAFRDTARIVVANGASVTGIMWSGGPDWDLAMTPTVPDVAQASGPILVPLRAVAAAFEGLSPLRLSFELNGVEVNRWFDFSYRAYRREAFPSPTIHLGSASPPPANAEPRLVEPAKASPEDYYSAPESPASSRTITAYGRCVYTPPGGYQIGAYGLTVRVQDNASILAETTTDPNGDWSVTFVWSGTLWDANPDIKVTTVTENSSFRVQSGSRSGSVYESSSEVSRDFTGTSYDDGEISVEDKQPWHILTTAMRAKKWLTENGGYGSPGFLEYRWPSDGATYYWHVPSTGEAAVYIESDREWSEGTIVHEYGHHWMRNYNPPGYLTGPDYCNGTCDYEALGISFCSHCAWCDETVSIAWNEGFSGWLGDVIPDSFLDTYGKSAVDPDDFELRDNCYVDGSLFPNTAELAEGFTAAVLNDLSDAGDDREDGADLLEHGIVDEVTVPAEDILDTIVLDTPTSIRAFLRALKDRVSYPSSIYDIGWGNEFESLDDTGPGAISSLTSSSHAIGVESADATIDFSWMAASDDFSGLAGYSIRVATTTAMPDLTVEKGGGALVLYTSDYLAAGSYYICVRAIDEAGNGSNSYVSSGPYVIRDPAPADLTNNPPPFWEGPLVLRNDDVVQVGNVQKTQFLDGETANTYWHLDTYNAGDSSTSGAFTNGIFIDGEFVGPPTGSAYIGLLAGMSHHSTRAGGPLQVRGGRHTISAHYDNADSLAEPIESDNTVAVSRVFRPAQMTPGAVESRVSPPQQAGGHADFQGPPNLAPNQDGLAVATTDHFNVVAVWPVDPAVNIDCALYATSTSQTTGFGIPGIQSHAYSTRDAGCLDAVIVNQNAASASATWDVGVLRAGEATSTYKAVFLESGSIANTGADDLTLGANALIGLYHFSLDATRLGYNLAEIQITSGSGPLGLAWVGAKWTEDGLDDVEVSAGTDASGHAGVAYDVGMTGEACLVVWRDPKDYGGGPYPAVTFDISIGTMPTDLSGGRTPPPGWHSAMVPLSDGSGTPSSVPLPGVLEGDSLTTYLNFALYVDSPTGSGTASVEWLRDGLMMGTVSMPPAPDSSFSVLNVMTPVLIPPGRHTLGYMIDPANLIRELSESNNFYGEQFVWEPPGVMAPGSLIQRPMPASLTGGWDEALPSGMPLYFNCDGVEIAPGSGRWFGLAAAPASAAEDVDVRLHPSLPGPKSSFDVGLVYSGWGRGHSDFVLVNRDLASAGSFQVGILGIEGTGNVDLQALESNFLAADPTGTYGPYSLAAPMEIVRLHEVVLLPGVNRITLHGLDPDTDWGLSVHPGNLPYVSKSTVVGDGMSWLAGAGAEEIVSLDIPPLGGPLDSVSVVIAAWPVPAAGGLLSGDSGSPKAATSVSYTLTFEKPQVGTAESQPIPGFGLRGVAPNPFSRSAEVRFEMDRGGPAIVDIVDIRGAVVRRIADGDFAAGRHSATWDGKARSGREVAQGIYFAVLRSGGQIASSRIVKLP